MEQFSFTFTIVFMLLGPIKLIPLFGRLTHGADSQFKRDVAIRAVAIAAGLCVLVAVVGTTLLGKYHISLDALRIAAGLVLLIAALQVIFAEAHPLSPATDTPTALQLAASPIAVPGIVPPAGVAAILIGMMLAQADPGMRYAVAISLAIVLALDLLVMVFIDRVLKTPGLAIASTVVGSVLVFVQVGLAIQIMLLALKDLGLFRG
jgi:multiple antibiotic resistance protein